MDFAELQGELEELTAEEMMIIDENSEYIGVSRLLLMENAGRSVADVIEQKVGIKGKKVVVIAGKGNKGGDGFVAARHIACRGGRPTIIIIGKGADIEGKEAKYNWEVIRRMDSSVRLVELGETVNLEILKSELDEADVIVDALIGTGLRGPLREPLLSVVKMINSCEAFKVSIDVPTGIDPSTGEVQGEAIRANVTVTMHKLKKGLKGRESYAGEVIIANIGIPPEAEIIVGPGDVRYVVRRRPLSSKKGDWGRVLVVGGGWQYSGAPALAGLAALRGGCDLVVVITPDSVSNVIRSFSPNLIVREVDGSKFTLKHVDEVVKVADRFDCIVVGPGMGVDDDVFEFTRLILEKFKVLDKPTVIDADALKALAGHLDIVKGARTILTPHAGEFKLLFNIDLGGSWVKKAFDVMKIAREHEITLLVKAHPEDIISDGLRVKVNMTGNPAMTVGGTGDVLTGIVASILSRRFPCLRAAAAGSFICGAAGSLAAEEKGYHILATDVIDKIPEVMRRFEPWTEGLSMVIEKRRI